MHERPQRDSFPEPEEARSDLPQFPREHIAVSSECPVCGGSRHDRAGAFNKFVLFPHPPDEQSFQYEYVLCRECGVVFASRRPTGPRFAWLVEHFEETIGRAQFGERRSGKAALASYALTDAEREHLRGLASRGVYVSDHSEISRKEYLPALMNDRLSNSVHLEILGSLLNLKQPRVLEVRSRLGSISHGLIRLFGATPHAMALFENQELLIREVYGIPVTSGIDCDHFQIPFEGTFDLIVSNHMFTHAVRPREVLQTLHERLVPGGFLYLFNEPDEDAYLKDGKSMFKALNAFHLQAFDGASLARALEANGFSVTFSTTWDKSHICLAQKREVSEDWIRIPKSLRSRRRRAYHRAFDAAAVQVPEHARERLGEPWDQIVARAVETGVAEVTKKGLRLTKR